MDTRTAYLIQILEKIGSPLMASILAAPDSAPEKDAQIMATLLGKLVQASIDIGNLIDLSKAGEESDSIRLALAGLSSPLVATQFEKGGKAPEEADLKRLSAALQPVLAFAENFAPSEDNTQRLANIAATGQGGDAHQVNVQYIQAFVPVVTAVHEFSFGQQPQKLIMDIARRLTDKAMALREGAFQNLAAEDQKRVELAFVKTAADIYAACHGVETKRLAQGGEQKGIESVWEAFETRMAMIDALAKTMTPGMEQIAQSTDSAAPAATGQTTAPATPPPMETTPVKPPPETPPASAPPAAPVTPPQQEAPPAPAQSQTTGANPMGFFAKKPAGDTPPPASPPPTEPAPPTEPPVQPPATPPEEPKNEQNNPQANPMSFFKPSKDDEDE